MKVIFVFGATATGKSKVALQIAQQFKAEIINCDSVQLFKDFIIGAAQPSEEDFLQCPHHLYGVVDPRKTVTAGTYQKLAMSSLADIANRTSLAVVVGGTGFYFQALEKGLLPIAKADAKIQDELMAKLKHPEGAQELHQRLQEVDPKSAARISVNDHYRLVRALEIFQTNKKSLSQINEEFLAQPKSFPYPLLKLGLRLEKEKLKVRIAARVKNMIEQGLFAEVKNLYEIYGPEAQGLQSIGYREVVEVLKNAQDPWPQSEKIAEAITQNTLALAKKQRTWFQRDHEAEWFQPEQSEALLEKVGDFLSQSGQKS